MNNDPKIKDFKSSEDLVIFLNLIIELSLKHFNRYDVYYDELSKKSIKTLSEITNIETNKITEFSFEEILLSSMNIKLYSENRQKHRLRYIDYKSLEDKMNFVGGQLLNLLGDRTKKGGVSYWRFREEIKKLQERENTKLLDLTGLDEKLRHELNKLYSERNYTHHMTDAKFIEWENYRRNQLNEHGLKLFEYWPTEKIEIDVFEYVEVEWLWQFYLAQIEFKKSVKNVIQQMKKDYSILYKKSIQIQKKYYDVMNCSHFEISMNGIERHLGKKK